MTPLDGSYLFKIIEKNIGYDKKICEYRLSSFQCSVATLLLTSLIERIRFVNLTGFRVGPIRFKLGDESYTFFNLGANQEKLYRIPYEGIRLEPTDVSAPDGEKIRVVPFPSGLYI